MTDLSVPNSFSPNTVALSGQVNADFSAIATFLNTTGVAHYQTGSVGTPALADSSVTTAKIVDGTIVGSDVASLTITAANIANATITGNQIAGTTIAANNLAANCVTTSKILDGVVTPDKCSNDVFGQWRDIQTVTCQIDDTNGTNGIVMISGLTSASYVNDGGVLGSGGINFLGVFAETSDSYLMTGTTRLLYFRWVVSVVTGPVNPAASLGITLRHVTSISSGNVTGSSGFGPVFDTGSSLGANNLFVGTGTPVSVTTPFSFPLIATVGWDSAPTAGGSAFIVARLQARVQ